MFEYEGLGLRTARRSSINSWPVIADNLDGKKMPKDAKFHSLWPTVLLERDIPGHEAANKALIKLVESLEQDRPDLTTDYLGGNFLAHPNPASQWLKDCVNKTIIEYFNHVDMGYPINWTLQGWANINRTGDYHDPHNHPHSYLSGTYYVRIPKTPPKIGSRGDVRSGCISFYDPRSSANMTAIRRDPNIEAEFTVRPRAGLMLLWPAFLQHFVHPNLSEEPRISISFNVVLKWSDSYLPSQG
jgi:uncharacterized protein (TIGR02466 family)